MSQKVNLVREIILEDLDLESEIIEKLFLCTFDTEYVVTVLVYEGRPAKVDGPPEDCYPEEPADVELFDSSFTLACDIITPIKHELDVAEIVKLVTALEKWILTDAQSEEFKELAFEKASSYDGPDRLEDRDE